MRLQRSFEVSSDALIVHTDCFWRDSSSAGFQHEISFGGVLTRLYTIATRRDLCVGTNFRSVVPLTGFGNVPYRLFLGRQ